MNPITRELERLGWIWNSQRQLYVYSAISMLTLSYEEAKGLVESDQIKKYTNDKIKEHTQNMRKERRVKK